MDRSAPPVACGYDLAFVEDEEFLALAADIMDNDPPFAVGFFGVVDAKSAYVAVSPVLHSLHFE